MLRRANLLAVLGMFVLLTTAGPLGAAEGRVELELVTESGFPLTGSQKWVRFLGGLDLAGVRIRPMRPGDRIETVRRGTNAAPLYHVTGVLTSRNKLRLPGGTFSLGDRGRLADWIGRTAAGPQDPAKRKSSFGLNGDQLEKATGDLAAKVDFSTKDVKLTDLIERIGRTLKHPLRMSAAARRALAVEDLVRDEMKGLSCGTTLAAALRPMGLVLTPRVAGASHEYLIQSGKQVKEIWPIGWPSTKPSAKLVPEIVKIIDVELEDIPLAKALAAVQPRLDVPFLLDHNSMAISGIDAQRAAVSIPKGRRTYGRILRSVLFQAKMKYELRVDDADQPFFWITTMRNRR